MTFDNELTLISTTYSENDMGDMVPIETPTVVLCDVLSVTRSEHYAAAANGLKPELVFQMNKYEYEGQKEVEFEGTKYKVSRTYKPKEYKNIADFETLELICEGLV